jgi:hypothetical protein
VLRNTKVFWTYAPTDTAVQGMKIEFALLASHLAKDASG